MLFNSNACFGVNLQKKVIQVKFKLYLVTTIGTTLNIVDSVTNFSRELHGCH